MAETRKRVLLKLSGEALMGNMQFGHDLPAIENICEKVKTLHDNNIEVCIVIGGGNIIRGVNSKIERNNADYMGMLGTVINALALQSVFTNLNLESKIYSAIEIAAMCEPFNRNKVIKSLNKSKIVIFAAGTGNPYFSTDSAAVLRAIEMNCQVLLKATQVDGVYTSDPKLDNTAKKYAQVSYQEILEKNLKIMDSTAIALAKDHKLPIIVFSMAENNNLVDIVNGKGDYTTIN